MMTKFPGGNPQAVSVAPVIPAIPEVGQSGLVVDCPPHALPFGIIFEEYAARRGDELKRHVEEALGCDGEALAKLQDWLEKRNEKYHELAERKAKPLTPPSTIDALQLECSEFDRPLKRILHRMNGSALCLSGGGIRSASFGLGVLEGLARYSLGVLSPAESSTRETKLTTGLLHKLDYLSTVSGGGYIGSWLSAWIYRRRSAEIKGAELQEEAVKLQEMQEVVEENSESATCVGTAKEAHATASQHLRLAITGGWRSSYSAVLKTLGGISDFTSGDPAPQPVRHLRDYTSYLAPGLGLSLDTWDLAAIVFRNLLVNWVMLVPLLLAAVAVPQMSYQVIHASWFQGKTAASYLCLGLVIILFMVAAIFSGRELPSHRNEMNAGPRITQLVFGLAAPVLLANWIVIQVWEGHSSVQLTTWDMRKIAVFLICSVGFVTLAMSLFHTYRKRILKARPELVEGWRGVIRLLFMLGAAVVAALVTTELLGLLGGRIFPHLLAASHYWKFGFTIDDRLYTIFALPLITLVLLVSHSLFSGLLGVFEQEEDREWISRAGGLVLALMTFWVVAHVAALYAAEAVKAIWLALGSGVLLGGIGSALGWSPSTSSGASTIKSAQLSKVGAFLKKHDLLLPVLCAVALLLLTVGAAAGEYLFAGGGAATLTSHFRVFLALSVLACAINWAIKINLFSLHGMYRMRLMRAFLGASNSQRHPDAFTGFDPRDTPLETDLPAAPGAPLHIINTTLNLVGTQDLAWRERKAESFTFSSLHSGAWRLAYVPTKDYAGMNGASLATAMAISGAAFNPNMGYHSSPLVTLMMTFFNVRLGWWLPNPAREKGGRWPWVPKGADFLRMTGPTIALEPLILEAFGMTDSTYRWIELSDGGHFENLGLYEMVLRRCHNIIVIDAGADPNCQFEDLGNALRKIKIDLGIPIRFEDGLKMKAGSKPENCYCAVATIDYGCVDSDESLPESECEGTLIYLKAGLTGGEPPDVRQYALTHKTFPHETTANQFFNESQFESYHHLGSFEVDTIVKKGTESLVARLSLDVSKSNEAAAAVALGSDFEHFAKLAKLYVAKPATSSEGHHEPASDKTEALSS